uniref:Hexosyltransferase n=1 Tax=Chenopodium quinoa TaxID=63459 RepID=A0A803NCZ7_CHEQI
MKSRNLSFEDPTLYHYAIYSEIVIAVSVVMYSVVKNAKEPWKHVFHVVIDRKIVAAMKMYPDLHHIVLLDGDVEVQKDLTDLWNIDLDGKVNGAVESYFGSFHGYS